MINQKAGNYPGLLDIIIWYYREMDNEYNEFPEYLQR